MRNTVLALTAMIVGTVPCAMANQGSEDLQLKAAIAGEFETSRLPGIEQEVLKSAQGRAQRRDDGIILSLIDGRSITLRSHDECPAGAISETNCVEFYLVGDLPTRHAYVVRAAYYEGGDVRLIDDRTGHETVLRSIPRFSPDSSELIVIDNNEAYGELGFQIWLRDADGNGATPEWEHSLGNDPVYHLTYLIRWTDPDEIVLEFWTAASAGHPERKWPATLRRDESGWHLETTWPSD